MSIACSASIQPTVTHIREDDEGLKRGTVSERGRGEGEGRGKEEEAGGSIAAEGGLYVIAARDA